MNQILLVCLLSSIYFYRGECLDNLFGKGQMLGTFPAVPVGQNSILVLLNFNKIFYECKIISAGLNAFEGTKAAVVSLSGKLPNLLLQGPVPLDCLFKLPSIPESRKPGAFNLRGNWFPRALEKSASKTLYQEQLEQASLSSDLVEKLRKMKMLLKNSDSLRDYPEAPSLARRFVCICHAV